jgi:hypothetical protein
MNQRTSREIEADIEETRTETTRTMDEIQARLSPSEIIDQVLWQLRSGGGRTVAQGAGEFASNLGRTIRENPVPSLLIGTGLAWLALTNMRGPRHEDDHDFYDDEPGRHPAPGAARYSGWMRHDEGTAATTTPEPDRPRTPTVEAILASDPHKPFGATR